VTVGQPVGERVEVFAEGLGAWTENFKKLAVQGTLVRTRSRFWAEKGYAAQLESFLNGIRRGREPEVTVRDGVRATIGCLRMLEAARTQRVVPIDIEDAPGARATA
jgi:predicted dehydrogenase